MLPAIMALLVQADEGLTLAEIMADIPRDPAAILTYALIVVSIAFVVYGARGGRRKREGGR